MIRKGTKNIQDIFYNFRAIQHVYFGTKLIFEKIRSCFGNGYWINAAPWINTDGWRNN